MTQANQSQTSRSVGTSPDAASHVFAMLTVTALFGIPYALHGLESAFPPDVGPALIRAFWVTVVMLGLWGVIKGLRNQVVIFFDMDDLKMSFLIIGAPVLITLGGAMILMVVLGSPEEQSPSMKTVDLIGSYVFGAAALVSFLILAYHSTVASLAHNRGIPAFSRLAAVAAKAGLAVCYPLVLLLTVMSVKQMLTVPDSVKTSFQLQRHRTQARAGFALFGLLSLAGAWLIGRLVNGEQVYLARGWTHPRGRP